jgi:hypothetical protein
MPLIGTFGAASSRGFGKGAGGGTPYNVQYLVVGGGGGAGNGYGGGGGGAGGFRTIASKTFEVVTNTNYTVTVGIGGTVDQAEADLLHGYQLLTTQVELETHHL